MLNVLEFMIDVEHEVVYDDPAAPLKLPHWCFIKFGYPLLDDKIIQMVLDLNLSLRAYCCKNQIVLLKTKDSLSKKSKASLALNCHWEVEFNESHDKGNEFTRIEWRLSIYVKERLSVLLPENNDSVKLCERIFQLFLFVSFIGCVQKLEQDAISMQTII